MELRGPRRSFSNSMANGDRNRRAPPCQYCDPPNSPESTDASFGFFLSQCQQSPVAEEMAFLHLTPFSAHTRKTKEFFSLDARRPARGVECDRTVTKLQKIEAISKPNDGRWTLVEGHSRRERLLSNQWACKEQGVDGPPSPREHRLGRLRPR